MHETPPQIPRELEQAAHGNGRHPRPRLEPAAHDQLAEAAEAEDHTEQHVGPKHGEVAVGRCLDRAFGRDFDAGSVGGHGYGIGVRSCEPKRGVVVSRGGAQRREQKRRQGADILTGSRGPFVAYSREVRWMSARVQASLGCRMAR